MKAIKEFSTYERPMMFTVALNGMNVLCGSPEMEPEVDESVNAGEYDLTF